MAAGETPQWVTIAGAIGLTVGTAITAIWKSLKKGSEPRHGEAEVLGGVFAPPDAITRLSGILAKLLQATEDGSALRHRDTLNMIASNEELERAVRENSEALARMKAPPRAVRRRRATKERKAT